MPAGADGIPLRMLVVGDIEMRVADVGNGPPVVLLHGFPELWYSWRHQIPALADAGYRAIAPDLRGFGGTSAPPAIEAYDVLTLCGDVLALLDELGEERAIVVGHDWGSMLAWALACYHPDRVAAVVGMSVPFVPRPPAAPLPAFREHMGEDYYIVWFQEPGVADAALARDVRRTLCTTEVWDAAWAARAGDDPRRPRFWTAEDLDHYVRAYERTGFTGGLNWYRNLDRNWALTESYAERRVEQPALYLLGTRDPIAKVLPPAVMDGWVTDLREVVEIEGAGHWLQQDAPAAVNAALLEFLAGMS